MSNGDGWTRCALGHRHWGLFGAAGLLVVRGADVLMQLRALHVHNGDTWSIPGGACHPDESATQTALRESWEETGLPESSVEPGAVFVDDHGGWAYTTVIASLVGPFEPRNNFESAALRWVAVGAVVELPLHKGFAHTWPELSASLIGRTPRTCG